MQFKIHSLFYSGLINNLLLFIVLLYHIKNIQNFTLICEIFKKLTPPLSYKFILVMNGTIKLYLMIFNYEYNQIKKKTLIIYQEIFLFTLILNSSV